jgi:hypothetical protein
MHTVHEDCFVVFVRRVTGSADHPDVVEQRLVSFATYAEARRVQREFRRCARDCVIRYVGPAGGGD